MLLCFWISQTSVKNLEHAHSRPAELLSHCQDHMQERDNFVDAIQRRWD